MKIFSRGLVFSCIVVFLFLGAFSIKMYQFNLIPNEEIEEAIRDLKNLDAKLTERIFVSNADDFFNYDKIVEILSQERVLHDNLMLNLYQKIGGKVDAALKNYLELKNKKNSLIKRYIPTNVQLKSSLSYFPLSFITLQTELEKEKHRDEKTKKIVNKIERVIINLVSDVQAYILSKNDKLVYSIEGSMFNLRENVKLTDRTFPHLDRFLAHMDVIIRSAQVIQDFMPIMTSKGTTIQIDLIGDQYANFYKSKEFEVSIYRSVFYPFVVLLLLLVGLLFYQLEMTREQHRKRMERELTTAQAVQETLFPSSNYSSDDLEICGSYEPASECGGDWWYYSKVGSKYLLCIGDATGHGVSAALVTSAARAAASIVEQMPVDEVVPSKVMKLLNHAIFDTSKGSMMMTFFVALYDPKSCKISYSNAGHEPPALFNYQDKNLKYKKFRFLSEVNGHRLGHNKESEYQEASAVLEKDDMLLFYTDGITELTNSEKKMFGERKLLNGVASSVKNNKQIGEMVSAVMKDAKDFCQDEEPQDDITFFLTRVKGAACQNSA